MDILISSIGAASCIILAATIFLTWCLTRVGQMIWGPLRLLCRVYIVHTVYYSTPLLDDHKRRSLSEVSSTISRILLIAASAKQTKPELRVVTGSLYCTDYLPIIFNVPSSYLAPWRKDQSAFWIFTMQWFIYLVLQDLGEIFDPITSTIALANNKLSEAEGRSDEYNHIWFEITQTILVRQTFVNIQKIF